MTERQREEEEEEEEEARCCRRNSTFVTVVFRCIKIEYVSLIYTHAHTHTHSPLLVYLFSSILVCFIAEHQKGRTFDGLFL